MSGLYLSERYLRKTYPSCRSGFDPESCPESREAHGRRERLRSSARPTRKAMWLIPSDSSAPSSAPLPSEVFCTCWPFSGFQAAPFAAAGGPPALHLRRNRCQDAGYARCRGYHVSATDPPAGTPRPRKTNLSLFWPIRKLLEIFRPLGSSRAGRFALSCPRLATVAPGRGAGAGPWALTSRVLCAASGLGGGPSAGSSPCRSGRTLRPAPRNAHPPWH